MGNDCAIRDLIEDKLIACYELRPTERQLESVGSCVLLLQTFGGFETCSILTKGLGQRLTWNSVDSGNDSRRL